MSPAAKRPHTYTPSKFKDVAKVIKAASALQGQVDRVTIDSEGKIVIEMAQPKPAKKSPAKKADGVDPDIAKWDQLVAADRGDD